MLLECIETRITVLTERLRNNLYLTEAARNASPSILICQPPVGGSTESQLGLMKQVGSREARVENLLGPESIVIGIK